MCTTLIVPGLNGSDEGHWQRHWLLEDSEAQLVDQQNWECPVLEDWLERLEAALAATESAYIVAHSLGCLLVANMATRPVASKIRVRFWWRPPISTEWRQCIHASSASAHFLGRRSPSPVSS